MTLLAPALNSVLMPDSVITFSVKPNDTQYEPIYCWWNDGTIMPAYSQKTGQFSCGVPYTLQTSQLTVTLLCNEGMLYCSPCVPWTFVYGKGDEIKIAAIVFSVLAGVLIVGIIGTFAWWFLGTGYAAKCCTTYESVSTVANI